MGEYNADQRLDRLFAAMADPTRRAILARLTHESARVTELARDFPISLNSTSKHIKILERAGLVVRTVNGRDHLLSLNAAPLVEAADWVRHFESFWEERLAALDHLVSAGRNSAKEKGDG
jgi:DNA-binding transcriptional ArsR family regulator